MITLAEWLDVKGIVLDPLTVDARWQGRTDLATCLATYDRCIQDDCLRDPDTGKRACNGLIPFPSVEPDGSVIDRWGACPILRRHTAQIRTRKLLQRAQMPPHLQQHTFTDFRVSDGTRDAYEAAMARVESNRGLVLAGPSGVGKTHLASALVMERIELGQLAVFTPVPELVEDLRRAQRDPKLEALHTLLVRDTVLLVLDDLGAQRMTDFAGEQLFLIVNGRLNWRRTLVVTTNYDTPSELADALGKQMGKRIISRLCEACEWQTMVGPDGRMPPPSPTQPALL